MGSAPMKMFLSSMVFTGMNTEDIQTAMQPLMSAWSTVFTELGSKKADAYWGRAFKKAKFIKMKLLTGKASLKFKKLMKKKSSKKSKLKIKIKSKGKAKGKAKLKLKVKAKPKAKVAVKGAAKPKVAVKAKVAAKPKVAVKAKVATKKRRMQAAASSSSSSGGPTLVSSGGANMDAYQDTGLPSIERLQDAGAKLMSFMGMLALALIFVIN